jgi:opacity protein-like surface antigen
LQFNFVALILNKINMKKIIFTLAAVFAFGFANAQDKKESSEGFSKGNVFLSGGLSFGSDTTGDEKSSSFTFAPAVGFFVAEKIAVGVRFDITSGKEENPPATDVKTTNFTGEVFGRYYFTPASKFSVFAELAAGIGSNKTTVGPIDAKSQTFGVNAGAGINYFVSNHWSIEAGWAGLGFNSDDNGGNGAEKTNSFGLNVDLSSINFGLNYKF